MAKPFANKNNFDIHKTLPNKHSQRSKNRPLEDIAEFTPVEKKHGFSFKRAFLSIIIFIFLFFIVIGVWNGVELSHASKKMFGSGNLYSLLFSNDLKTDKTGRVNILLAGYSADDAGHSGANLTDSIILISLNRTTKSGYMLSIPRDLWVDIAGYDPMRINAVYENGEWDHFSASGYPDGGMGLLERTVSDKFGVKINYFSLINYAAFRDTVNAVGGITIDIKSTDPRGIYDPSIDYTSATCCALANYPNGPVKLNGKQALNLARARGDSYGSYGFAQADFDRTEHQRQMLLALKQKVATTRTIINPLKSSHIFDGMTNNVKTDVDIGAALPLFRLFNNVNATNLQSFSLRNLNGKNYLKDYGGALIPVAGINDFSAIQAAVRQLNQ